MSQESLQMNTNTYNLLRAIGECHQRLKQHAINILKCEYISSITHASDIPDLKNGFRLEEYVDAELVTGDAISWCLEMTATLQGIVVEADVRQIHRRGQDVLLTIAEDTYSTEAACSTALPEITKRLCSFNPIQDVATKSADSG
jgi:hypothetical protein